MDHGWPARWGVNGRPSAPAGIRRNATRLPSGDQAGSASESTLGSRKRSAFVATSYTAMNEWSPRSLTKASLAPSGDQRIERADPRA